jgi:uncharacterized protein YktB (UPF0637 family)
MGAEMAPFFGELCGVEMFPHVAKHARRKVNPPNDTWVAWASNRRGYKALPHFQFGMWGTHVFVQFAVIYESGNKAVFAAGLERELAAVRATVPDDYVWSMDHMKPDGTRHAEMTDADFAAMIEKLRYVKASEVTCGVHIDREDPVLRDGAALAAYIREVYTTLLPLYRLSF